MNPGKGRFTSSGVCFADVKADVDVLVDGDGAYDAASTPEMVRLSPEDRLDMVNCARISHMDTA